MIRKNVIIFFVISIIILTECIIVFKNKCGFSDNPNNFGGRTNMGITQKTYDDYCRRNNVKTKDVKKLTTKEALNVYYKDYWEASGADKIQILLVQR